MFIVILFIFLGIALGYTLRTRLASKVGVISALNGRIIITEYRGAELGTIALLANIIREMITLLLTPLLAKWFGPLAPISSGGATTMDTTLPIITQTVGQRYVALSIYHGFVTDFTVPFFVTMWCTLA